LLISTTIQGWCQSDQPTAFFAGVKWDYGDESQIPQAGSPQLKRFIKKKQRKYIIRLPGKNGAASTQA
jgi:hypothetical protein